MISKHYNWVNLQIMYFLYDNVFLQFWNSEARGHRLFSFFFQWLVSLCRKMGLVYIRQVHVIGTILQMEVVQSDGKTKLCTVLCQFLDWPFKTNKIITHNLPTMHCFYWLKHTLFFAFNKRQKNYSLGLLRIFFY